MEYGFAAYHPIVNIIFFIGAVGFGMFFTHPAFLFVSLIASSLYYLLLHGKKGIKFLSFMLLMFIAISVVNPLFNTAGATIIFTYFEGRVFTLEALFYGMTTGAMFCTVMIWFGCYNVIMTSDKFLYLFGKLIPAISLILSMVFRFIPNFQKQIQMIAGARRCIGKSPQNKDKKIQLENSMNILSVLTSWSLEGTVITADSMRSRGYGSGIRSHFSIYKKSKRDVVILGIMIICIIFILIAMFASTIKVVWFPSIIIYKPDIFVIFGLLNFGIFLFLPSIIYILEDILWHILRSKI